MSLVNLFVYGTLCRAEIYQEVTGDPQPPMRNAVLHGYALGKPVHGYPAIWPREGTSTDGFVLVGVSEKALVRLDDYEGLEYERVEVEVSTLDGILSAFVYIGKS